LSPASAYCADSDWDDVLYDRGIFAWDLAGYIVFYRDREVSNIIGSFLLYIVVC
jgi:hypothetical protein